MSRSILRWVLLPASLLALTGCTPATISAGVPGPQATADLPPWTSSEPAAATTEDDNLSPRGLLPIVLGQEHTYSIGDEPQYRFWVDKVNTNVRCDDPYGLSEPENGRFISLSFRIESMAKVDNFAQLPNPFEFSIYSPEGVVESNVSTVGTYACLPESQRLASGSLAPSSRYEGSIVLDTKNKAGIIAYRPGGGYSNTGFEISF